MFCIFSYTFSYLTVLYQHVYMLIQNMDWYTADDIYIYKTQANRHKWATIQSARTQEHQKNLGQYNDKKYILIDSIRLD